MGAAVILSACQPAPMTQAAAAGGVSTGSAELEGGEWRIARIAGATTSPLGTMAFADGKVSGAGPCNRYFGSYEAPARGALSFGPFGMTRMACPGARGAAEVAFTTAAAAVRGYVSKPGGLALIDDAGRMVIELEKL